MNSRFATAPGTERQGDDPEEQRVGVGPACEADAAAGRVILVVDERIGAPIAVIVDAVIAGPGDATGVVREPGRRRCST